VFTLRETSTLKKNTYQQLSFLMVFKSDDLARAIIIGSVSFAISAVNQYDFQSERVQTSRPVTKALSGGDAHLSRERTETD
jgi:hypothetical protein